ncbi:MAG TPA: DNA-3-methyladenine glycosylase [Methylophilaceae bacterium]|nr:DNA-3-methyladenine glycosylase [Methylophilaceae bacterium]
MAPDYAAAAVAFLSAQDEDWARLIKQIGPYSLKLHAQREPYEALIRAIAYQQLHARAAEAILGRLVAQFPEFAFPPPQGILDAEEERLRACGFSASKIRALKGIAAAAQQGMIPSATVAQGMSDEALIKQLVTLRGVGQWTVEMLLIFTLGRTDVLPVDDFGVREGWRKLKRLPEQPKPRALGEIGQAWSPYRTAAAWYLWQAAGQAAEL